MNITYKKMKKKLLFYWSRQLNRGDVVGYLIFQTTFVDFQETKILKKNQEIDYVSLVSRVWQSQFLFALRLYMKEV